METKNYHIEVETLRNDIRIEINSYSCSFDSFKIKQDGFNKIHFTDNDGIFEREMAINEIVAEGSNIGIYPISKKYLAHSENTIDDIHDLLFILSKIKEHTEILNDIKGDIDSGHYSYNDMDKDAIDFFKFAVKCCPEHLKNDIIEFNDFVKKDKEYGDPLGFTFNKEYIKIFKPLNLDLRCD
jgi:hypothetical protein